MVVDMHQYGSMPSGLDGQNAAATTEFVTAWGEIAKRLRGTPNIIFGFMNEPNQQSTANWLQGVSEAIAAIRKAGAIELVVVSGSYWDGGAHNWTSTDNSTVILAVKDQSNDFTFEVHQYLDQYSTGTTAAVAKGSGETSLIAFTTWARQHHAKGFLGESGFATPATPWRRAGPARLHGVQQGRLAQLDLLGRWPLVRQLHVLRRTEQRKRQAKYK